MKFRHIIFLAIGTALLSACNFTLAADVTPPPNYVPPTPMPTLGPLYPVAAPNIENGKAIYAEKCMACHGETGLGDGSQSKDLPVAVIPIGLPQYGNKAAPADWYSTVTQGRLDRFMPPFNSLTDQERWDVVSYALTLHTTNEQIESGKSLFEENCADCGDAFTNLEMMSALSADDLVGMMRSGGNDLPAFGSNFSDEEAYAVAAYIRTLTFAPPAAPVVDSATETPVAAETEAPSADATAVDGTPQAEVTPEATEEPAASVGGVSGVIDNRTGKPLPSDLVITLRGFEHGADPNAGPQEFITLDSTVNADGTYSFETPISENEIYIADVEVDGVPYQSSLMIVEAGVTELTLPDIVIYETTTDTSDLFIDEIAVHFEYADPETVNVFVVYLLRNTGDKNIKVLLENNMQDIPFIKAPANATSGLGFQTMQDGATIIGTQEQDGFYIMPSEETYGLIAFTALPRSDKIEFSQEFILPVGAGSLFLPQGVTAEGDKLTDNGLVPLQDSNGNSLEYQTYSISNLEANSTLSFTINGSPKDASATPDLTQNQNLLIGIGAFGVVLIIAGIWLYLRDRKKVEETDEDEEVEDEEDEYEDAESVMDAIIALDDLHRAGKITDEAYKLRRDELKEALKRKG